MIEIVNISNEIFTGDYCPTPSSFGAGQRGKLGTGCPVVSAVTSHPDLKYCGKNETSISAHVQLVALQHHLTSVDVYHQ
jgi:hypothetical protein